MNRFLCSVIFGWTLILCPALQAGQLESGRPQLRVCVHNVARVSDATLSLAKNDARQIFEESGIDLIWLDKVNIGDAHLEPPVCLTLIIAPSQRRAEVTPKTLGTTAKGGPAWVFYDRVEFFLGGTGSPLRLQGFGAKAQVLSVVIAHEIGHWAGLSHSERGIMRAKLTTEGFTALRYGSFSAEESQELRASVNGAIGK